jgi:hypothetical protein
VLASELNDLDCNKVGVWFKTEFGLLFEKNLKNFSKYSGGTSIKFYIFICKKIFIYVN